jgi:rRNA maturation protein Nop10
MEFRDSIKDTCPACGGATTPTVIEPHLTRAGIRIYTFKCDECGSTKSKIVKMPLVA